MLNKVNKRLVVFTTLKEVSRVGDGEWRKIPSVPVVGVKSYNH